MDDKLFPDTSSYYKKTTKRSRGVLLIVLLLILLLIGIFLGIRYFGGASGTNIKGMLPVTPTPTQAPSPTPEAVTPTPIKSGPTPGKTTGTPTPSTTKTTGTPEPTTKAGLDRASLQVAVENGSGVSGAAGKMATSLRNLGYTVASTGNADNFDYTGVTIQVKATKKNYLTQLKSDLAKDYTITAATADLTGSSADAVVIIGK